LANYDYAQPGGYFIKIVTYHRHLLFGAIAREEMVLNDYGKIAEECWCAIPEHFPNIELGAYVDIPNHVHGIVLIRENMATKGLPLTVGARHVSPLPLNISSRIP
jgi:REP element-mobilizing transposase RayT